MGLCYSLRPLLFGDPEDVSRAASEAPAEDVRPGPAPAPTPARAPAAVGGDAVPTPLPRGTGGSPACARPKAAPKKERRRRPEQLRAEEREAEREAKKVSRSIDRMLREQKRDLQQTHRLLLLGRCRRRAPRPAPGAGAPLVPRGVGLGRRSVLGEVGQAKIVAALIFTHNIYFRDVAQNPFPGDIAAFRAL